MGARVRWAGMMALLAVAGCDDALYGLPLATSVKGGGGGGGGETALRYTSDWEGVMALSDHRCGECHSAGGSAETMPFPLALQVDAITGAGLWVVPYDPDGSALWRVLTGDLAAGDFGVMPLLGVPLPYAEVGHVRAWIEAGAVVPPLDLDGDGHASDVDCDESNPYVSPGQPEVCGDGTDNDCSGTADDAYTWFRDGDGDGYGSDTDTRRACDPPANHVAYGGDCDDTDAAFNPGAAEADCADPRDLNCDGSVGTADGDGDGYAACEECDDADAAISPDDPEVCDGVDNDCNGTPDDDATDAPMWWKDVDLDGYGDPNDTQQLHCLGTTGWVTNDGDCGPDDPLVNPDQTFDGGDGVDNDCDGSVDEDAGVGVSHAAQIQPIWNGSCLFPCHSGVAPSGGLALGGSAYDDLVGVPSGDVGWMNLVEPGDPANSYLWLKLTNTFGAVGGTGSDMPKNGGPLPQADLDLIEQWILDGALP